MENKIINTIEINGKTIDLSKKMVEVPRRKKYFESSKAYSKYLGSLLKEAFPYDENIHNIEDYDFFIEYNVYKLWEAADESKETLKSKVSRKISAVKEKFSKNNEEETEKEIVEEKEEKKENLISKILKPVKKIGKKIKKCFKWINSKMPWSKKKNNEDELDLEKMFEDAIENENDNDMAEEMLNDAEEELEREAKEELSKGVKEELAKEKEEEVKKLNESLNAKIEELKKEIQILKNRIEIYKKQPERDKVWEKYFNEQKEKGKIKEKIRNAEKEMNNNRFDTYKPSIILTEVDKENIKNACKTPYTITRTKNDISVQKNGIKEYQESQKLSETEDTITITGTLYENLLYSEYEFNVHMRDMVQKAYKVPFYQVDYNYDGLIRKNKEKISGKVINASVVLTKERYEELVKNATKYFNLMGEVSNYLPDELENENQKKLVK